MSSGRMKKLKRYLKEKCKEKKTEYNDKKYNAFKEIYKMLNTNQRRLNKNEKVK